MKLWTILFLITINVSTLNLYSQSSTSVPAQKKMALIIGNGNYNSSVLGNPENDARAMEKVLKRLGFIVFKYENLNQGQMKRAIDEFGLQLKNNDVGLFYYAGHGIQSNGYNFLVPTDAQLMTEKQVEYDCVQADRVLAIMEGSGTTLNIIILDACRNNPFERSWTRSSTGRGLAFMNAPGGTLIAYSTAPGSTASDGSGKNSPYTSAILESIEIPNITITQMFQNVARILSQKTARQQVPWISSSLTGDFYFNTSQNVLPNLPNDSKVPDTEDKNKISAENSKSIKENIKSIPSNIDSSRVASNKPSNSENLKNEVINSPGAPNVEYFVDGRDNQQYKSIKIGNQVWMAENLKTTKLIDGSPIPLVPEKNSWSSVKTFACCWYNNDEPTYSSVYGVLYNWHTVATGKLCPKEWHIPSDSEWSTLITYLGGLDLSGGKLKEAGISHWSNPNANATNEFSFSALPGGTRFKNGSFDFVGFLGSWWSSTEQSPDFAFYRGVYYNYGVVHKNYENKNAGLSVRCIRDEIKSTK
jgi:uncharacterized protein (TIGR02145 family)